jgi:VIT1/CCC1 family predicted Fe2+/Mn2+ transporter
MSADGAQDELRAAYLYRVVADAERGSPRESLFRELAQAAEGQARIWSEKSGIPITEFEPELRTRLVAAMVRRFGPKAMRSILAAMKVRGMSVYTRPVSGHRDAHAADGKPGRHDSVGTGGNLRAAVFGANDGLISNISLILGIAGATTDSSMILLTGSAGLIAGACAMAAGEYVSVRSQREMYEYQISLERDELDEYPEEEAAELALVYVHRGMERKEALELAKRLLSDPKNALDVLARDELGLNPDDLGSPWGAAGSSLLSFAVGAVVPLIPFVFVEGPKALVLAVILTGLALFGVGAVISLFTGKRAYVSGLRMLAIGSVAGAVTYGIGSFFGVSLA